MERGCRIVVEGAHREDLLAAVTDGVDAVLLDLDTPGCAAEARWLLMQRPDVRVIGCSAERPAMCVFDGEAADDGMLDAAALMGAIRAGRVSDPGGTKRSDQRIP